MPGKARAHKLFFVALCCAPLLGCAARQKHSFSANSVALCSVPKVLYAAPHWVAGQQELRLRYHLNYTNRRQHGVELRRLRIESLSRGKRLARLELRGRALERVFRPLRWQVIRSRQDLAAAHRLTRRYRRPPGGLAVPARGSASLLHLGRQLEIHEEVDRLRFTLELSSGDEIVHEAQVRHHRQKTSLRLPVRAQWSALAGHRSREPHASLYLLSQSFAYDLTRRGRSGKTFEGDPRKNASYPAYGQSVVAMAEGVIVALNDSVPDNRPGRLPSREQQLTRPQDLGGNYVVIDHGQGEFSATMHLQPGLKLRVGERVRAGQEIGRCGNSGNSLEPHVHVQLQDGADPLKAAGLPMRFGDFSFHYGQRALYVSPAAPLPLPWRLPLEAGRLPRALSVDRNHRRVLP